MGAMLSNISTDQPSRSAGLFSLLAAKFMVYANCFTLMRLLGGGGKTAKQTQIDMNIDGFVMRI
jgi:hypothetical protein